MRKVKNQTSTTFTPLKRKRYRCNQDGITVKQGRTHAHRVLRTQDPKAAARLAAARLEKQAEAIRRPSLLERRGSPV